MALSVDAESEAAEASRPVKKRPAMADDLDSDVGPDADKRGDAGNLKASERGCISRKPVEPQHRCQLSR